MSLILALKPSFLIHILVSFLLCFLLLDLISCRIRNLLSTFPSLWILFFYFWFGMNAKKYQVQRDLVKSLSPHKRIAFYSCGFIFFLSLTLLYLKVHACSRKSANIFSIAVHIFRNLYVKTFLIVCSVFIIEKVYTSWTSMFKKATFREILLSSSGNGRSISRNVAFLNIYVHDV